MVRKAAPGSRGGTRRVAQRGAAATVPTAHLPVHVEPLRFHAAGLYLDRWKQWIVPGEIARAEAQASRDAADVMDTLTSVLDALLASAVAVIEKDTLFHCVAEQIVERLPEGVQGAPTCRVWGWQLPWHLPNVASLAVRDAPVAQ